jgi:hypothetical protein
MERTVAGIVYITAPTVPAPKTCFSPTGTTTEFDLMPMWVLMVPDFDKSAPIAAAPKAMAVPSVKAAKIDVRDCIEPYLP